MISSTSTFLRYYLIGQNILYATREFRLVDPRIGCGNIPATTYSSSAIQSLQAVTTISG